MKNLLVLVGERHIARLVQVNLERQGYSVRIASSATEALRQIAIFRPDVILADVSMRFLGGMDVFKTLKRNEASRNIPLFMMLPPGSDVSQTWGSLLKGRFPGVPYLEEFLDDGAPDKDEPDDEETIQ